MIKESKTRWYIAVVLAVPLALSGVIASCQTVSVSLPHLPIQKNERVVGFKVEIQSGSIAKLPIVPYGWGITIDNDPSWNTTINGEVAVGAAALNQDFFHHFLVVEREKDAPQNAPFSLSGEIAVTSDFATERRIKVTMKDFAYKAERVSGSNH
jgi:hypothetical protein